VTADDKSVPARARQITVSPRTLYNVIARGEGPALTRVSERRVIIEDDVWADWLKTRRQHPPRRPAPEGTRPAREVDAVLVELAEIERRAAVHLESAPPKIAAD
jgi:hypothetical protein